jgi:hypothetical protein
MSKNSAKLNLVPLKEATVWASSYTGREVTTNNIIYLLNYAKIHAYDFDGQLKTKVNGSSLISIEELKEYYDRNSKEEYWKSVLG